MDFGDILNQWDKEQKTPAKKQVQKPNKKANAPSAEEKELRRQGYTSFENQFKTSVNPIEAWLNRHGTIDKDKINKQAEREAELADREYLKNMRPEAILDLHGLTRDEAWGRMDAFVTDCTRRGLRKIMVIHGKGNHSHDSDPVLGLMVRQFIEQDARLGRSGHPDRYNGGSGATWILIKGSEHSKNR